MNQARQQTSEPTILIVDDEDLTRRAMVRCVTLDVDVRVLEAASAARALELLAVERIDVVLSDYNMPGMSGVDLLRHVRLRHPGAVRLMITSSQEFDVVLRALNEGEVSRFLRKPWSDFDLVDAVRMALDDASAQAEVRKLRLRVGRNGRVLQRLECAHPGITVVDRDERGAIRIDDE